MLQIKTTEKTANPLFTDARITSSPKRSFAAALAIHEFMEPLAPNSYLNLDDSPMGYKNVITEENEFDDEVLEVPEELVLVRSTNLASTTSSSLQYCEITRNSLQECSLDNKSFLLYLRSLFSSSLDSAFEQVAPLTSRDLIRMHEAVSKSEEIVLLVRKHCIIFQIDPVKAIILSNRVFIIRMVEADVNQRQLEGRIVSRVVEAWHSVTVSSISQTLEIFMLDTLLTLVMEIIGENVLTNEIEVKRISKLLGKKHFLPPTIAERVRRVKTQVDTYQAWLASCRERLNEISEDDEEMALLNLTVLEKRRVNIDHISPEEISSLAQPIEDMLELFIVELSALTGRVNHLLMLLTNAKDTMQLRLRIIEDELLLAETNFQLFVCCFSTGLYVTAILGQNLDWSILAVLSFNTISIATSVSMVVSFIISRYFLIVCGILPVRVSKSNSATSWGVRLWQWVASE